MKIESIPFDLSLVRGSIPVHGNGERSSGLHVSDIWESMEAQIDPLPRELLDAYAKLGFVVEKVFEAGITAACLDDRYIRIGELELEGIAGSPDIIDTQDWAVIDTKCKWCSSKWAGLESDGQQEVQELVASKFRKEVVQLKTYCHMVGECTGRACTSAQLWFCFVNGDYKEIAKGVRSPPDWVARKLTFSANELVDNWAMLKGHAKEQGWI